MRFVVSIEGNGEGRVLASLDMQEIAKMTRTDDIEKSNFNPEMFEICTDTAHSCGYHEGVNDSVQLFLDSIKTYDTYGYVFNGKYPLIKLDASNRDFYEPYIRLSDVIKCIEGVKESLNHIDDAYKMMNFGNCIIDGTDA